MVYIWVPFHGILIGSWMTGDELIVRLYHLPIFVCRCPENAARSDRSEGRDAVRSMHEFEQIGLIALQYI